MPKQLSLSEWKSRIFNQIVFVSLIFFWVAFDEVLPWQWHRGTEKFIVTVGEFFLAVIVAVGIYKFVPVKFVNPLLGVMAILVFVALLN